MLSTIHAYNSHKKRKELQDENEKDQQLKTILQNSEELQKKYVRII